MQCEAVHPEEKLQCQCEGPHVEHACSTGMGKTRRIVVWKNADYSPAPSHKNVTGKSIRDAAQETRDAAQARREEVKALRFNGSDYRPAEDNVRLGKQLDRVFTCMSDGSWRTLAEIEEITNDPAASISAQLRHLRKARFGSHEVLKRSRGRRSDGLFEYQLVVNTTTRETEKCDS